MNCSISGEAPEEPVVSRKSGLLFDKRLIERHISEYGKCPVTGEELAMDDLIPVKAGKIVKPRPMQAASIPGMLNIFQNEWDALMLSHFSLEKQLHTAREELSHALYQHDAACRVIARLKRERDEARSMLAQSERPIPMLTSTSVPMVAVSNGVVENNDIGHEPQSRPGISEEIVAEITECNLSLSNQRKQRRIPPTLAAVNDVENYTQLASHPLHKTSKPGIVSLDVNYAKDIIVTGGVDSAAVIFDRSSGQILSTLSGHSKKVTNVKFVTRDDAVLTASTDKTVRIWEGAEDGNYMCKHTLRDHSEEVQAVTVHATNNYFVTASSDCTWCFYDLASGLCLQQVKGKPEDKGFTSAAFHPDGLILATGTITENVKIWDVKSQASVTQFAGHKGAITAMSFSENGYYLATAAHDGVRLWDLRKLKNFRVLSPYNEDTPTNSVEFDHSGSYLAIAGSDLRVYQVGNVRSDWDCIKSWPDLSGTGKITSAKFGPDAKYLAVGSMDRNLRIFGLPEGDDTAMES